MGGKLLFCTESNFIRIFKVRCGHRTLRFVKINAHFVGVDILRQSSRKVHSVGVDDHIDPESEESIFYRRLPCMDGEKVHINKKAVANNYNSSQPCLIRLFPYRGFP